MWNSPHNSPTGERRFDLADLSALVLPLDEILDVSRSIPVDEFVEEVILQRLERNEFVHVLYQVFEALLEDVDVPEAGHTGVQEAMIAELLSQAYAKVDCELDMPELGHSARSAVWNSVDRLLIHRTPTGTVLPMVLEEIGLKLSDPQPYLSEKLTHDGWHELLLGEGCLWGEFLWDDDWRMDSLMDLHPNAAETVTQLTGIDLGVVQALPHTPSDAELRMAEHYLSYVIWKDRVIKQRGGA